MQEETNSPRWNSTTKLVFGLSFVAIVAALLVRSQEMVTPLLLSFMLVYLFYPVAQFMNKKLRLPWGLSVTLLYLVLVVVVLGGLTLSGFEIIRQSQNLLKVVQENLDALPGLIDQVSHLKLELGPWVLDAQELDLQSILSQAVAAIQPLLGQTGELLTALAGGTFNVLAWTLFVLFVSYFLLAESGGLPEGFLQLNLPGYSADMHRMGQELAHIWNAFLRGQVILAALATVVYSVVLGGLGVNYAVGMALMAGAARFLPYVGPAISWTILALVAFFQDYKLFDMSAVAYTLTVLVIAWIIDGILDYIVTPRVMADTLQVHPAAVVVAALVAANLLGLFGVVVAAPILATFQLFGRYIFRKMFDLPPWEGWKEQEPPPPLPEQLAGWARQIIDLPQTIREKFSPPSRQK